MSVEAWKNEMQKTIDALTQSLNELSKMARKIQLPAKDKCACEECKTYIHKSDCAVHNEPAFPKGLCDCQPPAKKECCCINCESPCRNCHPLPTPPPAEKCLHGVKLVPFAPCNECTKTKPAEQGCGLHKQFPEAISNIPCCKPAEQGCECPLNHDGGIECVGHGKPPLPREVEDVDRQIEMLSEWARCQANRQYKSPWFDAQLKKLVALVRDGMRGR